MISLQHIRVSYGEKRVLDGLSLEIPMTGITCLHGPSGSGKTTILRLLAGLVTPQSGTISGKPQKPALLFQEDRLLPSFTALENIAAALPKARAEEARLWLAKVGLSGDGHLRPKSLSGGMQRRVALARALAYGGDFLLLDEPFTGLDMALTNQMAALVIESRTPALVVTHSKEEIALLRAGTIEVDGPPLRIIRA